MLVDGTAEEQVEDEEVAAEEQDQEGDSRLEGVEGASDFIYKNKALDEQSLKDVLLNDRLLCKIEDGGGGIHYVETYRSDCKEAHLINIAIKSKQPSIKLNNDHRKSPKALSFAPTRTKA
jgi:hypothetical protein